ncbi:diaminopimelate epimerase [Alphaproteobacteria bacterium]|nr:diaminopimelate epimerase [Alphaproteobacteria bacterium]
MRIPFIKAQGAGNDFIIIDKNIDIIGKSKKLIKFLCDRKVGIGCDQIILIRKNKTFYQIKFYNSDGSKANNCGNGLRCIYKYLTEIKKIQNPVIKTDRFTHLGKKIKNLYQINVGDVSLDWKKIPLLENRDTQNLKFTNIKIPGLIKIMSASIGNPHCIVLLKNLDLINIKEIGPKLANNKLFKNQANVTFVQKISSTNIKVLFWERGGGHTLACGSGTCAAAYTLFINNITKRNIQIKTESSNLFTSIQKDTVLLKGPAEIVFGSEILI